MAAAFGSNANAQSASQYSNALDSHNSIVTNHTVPPGPGNPATGANFANSPEVLDPAGSITGVGQQIAFVQTGPTTAGLGLCTGTLINPRTVITAAHCLYTRPADQYGSDTGSGGGLTGPLATALGATSGVPLSFGFGSTNRCLGVAVNGCAAGTGAYEVWRDSGFSTNVALSIYNANQVWYNRGAQPVALGGGGEFGNGDIALVTLDTHVQDIPTWTLLFSPLDGSTHTTMVGYGGAGVGTSGIGSLAGIDYRRRSAENMIDALMSPYDFVSSPAINGPGTTTFANLTHAMYWFDFDDPNHDPNNLPANFFLNTSPVRNNGYYDFNGLGGSALPHEATTAGGDSGGPLVVDERWDRPVVAGVLTGGFSFNGGIGTYGEFSVYPPLFLFWQEIVLNNPYVYASARAGIRDWMDPNHWVQDMDPNYAIIGADGELLNGVPDTLQGGADGPVGKFGTVCFLEQSCQDVVGPGNPTGTGEMIVTAGGPGSRNFVPNNVEPLNSADPALHRRARYYDVTLDAIGETRLNSAVTIDRLTVDGLLTSLDVRSGGTLNVLTDFTMGRGFLNVDGRINSGEALIIQGLLTGRGTFNPTYLTSVDGAIAPGGVLGVGTLTVQGDVVLASGNELLIELGRSTNDVLRVTADPAQATTGIINLGGDVWFTPSSAGGGPRHGNSYTFITAAGGVTDTFDAVNGFLGILRPQVTYAATSVSVKLKAGSFLDALFHAPGLAPLALALDEIRENHYASLYGLYGEIDLMNPSQLMGAFNALQPTSLLDARGLMAMQDGGFATTLQNRLALMSRSQDGPIGLSVMGAPNDVFAFSGDSGISAAGDLAFGSAFAQTRTVTNLPNGMTGFFSGGYDEDRVSAVSGRAALNADDAMRTWSMAGGVEQNFGDFTLGVAASYGRGHALQTEAGARAENDLAQSAVYGVYRFDDGLYLSGLVGVGTSRTTTERRFMAGTLDYHMQGETNGSIALASLEGGVNFDLAQGLVLTPRVSIQQTQMRMDGFTEAGGGETALAFDEQVYNRLEARFGVSLAGDFSLAAGWRFAPNIDVSAVSNLAGDEDGVWARFAAVDDIPFYLPGQARDDLWGEVTAGLALSRDQTSIALRLEQSVERQELYDDRVVARFAQRF
ncbi:outer membrane autotransporter barrel [alpha proteobacterium U9-1i]|nr:outer membrane autotransporter barrel [alpha proteobacterium U9-1i]